MREIDFDALGADDYAAAQFVAACAIGRQIFRNLQRLANDSSDASYPGLFDFIREFDNEIANFDLRGSSIDPGEYIRIFQARINPLAHSHQNKRPALCQVLLDIVSQIPMFRKGELVEHLTEMAISGFSLMQQCVQEWGGTHAKGRFNQVSPVKLRIQFEDKAEAGTPSIWTFCDDRTVIDLQCAKPSNFLVSYLGLPFSFFHEYLSHIFPIWGNLAGTFSEIFLFRVERDFFTGHCHLIPNGFPKLGGIILASTLLHGGIPRRVRSSAAAPEAEAECLWLREQFINPGFYALLLEVAAKDPTPSNGRFHQQLLAMLHTAAVQVLPSLITTISGIEVELAFERLDLGLNGLLPQGLR